MRNHPRLMRAVQRVWEHRLIGPPLRAVFAIAAVVGTLRLVFHANPAPAGVIVYGVVVGLLYAFIAFGLILVYRASRIINFAQAEIGAACGVLGVMLIQQTHLPYLLALAIAVVAGLISSGLTELLVIRRFANAPRLVVSVATIGVSLIFAALQLLIPGWFGAGAHGSNDAISSIITRSSPLHSPFSNWHFTVAPLTFDGNSIVIVAAAVFVVIGLGAFFTLTDIGLAVRAAAENRDRAVLLGLNVGRVSSVVWMLAGALAALGLFMRIPITGVPIGVFIGPSILLYALAAAVIARMESFGVALIAAVCLGIVEQAIYFSTRDPNVGVAVTLPVLLVVMLAQRKSLSRGQDSGVATWQLSRDYRLIPPELRGLREVRVGTTALGIGALAVVVLLPLALPLTQQILLSVVACYGIIAVSLVILTGWAGQISLGQWGFAAIGAAVSGGMATHLHADFFVTLLAAGLVGAALSLLVGLPALRIQGLFLAVTTLSFAVAVQVFVLSPRYFSWLLPASGAVVERPILFGRFDLAPARSYYYVALVVLLLALLSARSLRRSRSGRLLIAVRDNQRGAQSFGISVRRARLWAFAISGFWCSVAGALFFYHQGTLDSGAYGPELSLTLLTVVVIGGSTSLPGAILATAYLGALTYGGFSASIQLLASGLGALLLLLFLPGGLAQVYYGIRDVALRHVAARHGILVPSLTADAAAEAETADAEPQPAMPPVAARSLASISLRPSPSQPEPVSVIA